MAISYAKSVIDITAAVMHIPAMKAMERISVTFTDPQLKWLRGEARRLGISIADLLRRIIDAHREAQP